jgi:hypothetical protein
MELKYQSLIESQNLTIQCPPAECEAVDIDIPAARWVLAPIDNELNFLPNHIYNKNSSTANRPMSEKLKCGFCSVSFHESVEASAVNFYNLNPKVQEKLGYTHVAVSIIKKGAGLKTITNEESKHFELFEKNINNIFDNFQIVASLNS